LSEKGHYASLGYVGGRRSIPGQRRWTEWTGLTINETVRITENRHRITDGTVFCSPLTMENGIRRQTIHRILAVIAVRSSRIQSTVRLYIHWKEILNLHTVGPKSKLQCWQVYRVN